MGIENKRWADGRCPDDDDGALWAALLLTPFALALALASPLPEHP